MFDLFIYQEMRNIRRQHHISKEVILDWSAFVNVQDSHPYVAIGKISAETRRFFVALVMPLSVQILFRPTIADLATAIRLRSSVEQPRLVVISDPRKLNCVTCSTSVPSTTIGSSFPSLPTIMILVLLTFSRRPRASEVKYLNYTKRPNFACDNYILRKTRGNKTSSRPIPHPLDAF